MIRIFIVLLLLGIGVTQYQLWAGRASWIRLKELEQTLVAQRAANDRLRLQNEAFAAELYSLENQRDAIEERARWDLTMVKDREVLFRLEGEEVAQERVAASMPDYQKPDIKPGSDPTFEAKKSDLYHAPKHLSAPKARDRRE